MPKRLNIIFRVLSVLTSAEAVFGLLFTAMMMLVFPNVRTTLENRVVHPYLRPVLVMYLMALANVAFNVALVIASIFLWKLQRRGLFLLSCTLLAEAIYFMWILFIEVGTEMVKTHIDLLKGERNPIQGTFGAMMGVGNVSLYIQFLSAFPIVAGVLIFFAYRYLRIPARPLN
jgi:hypothetical protein